MWWMWATVGAYQLDELRWDPERLPLAWCAEGGSEAWPEDDFATTVAAAAEAWERPDSCVPVLFERVEDCAEADVRVAVDTADTVGTGTSHVIYVTADPEGELDRYDLVFDDQLDWLLPGAPCGGHDHYLASVVVHELGHALGLAHSCEVDDLCVEADQVDAAMHWSHPDCTELVPNRDDFAGLEALYAPWAGLSWTASQEAAEVCFTLDQDVPADLVASWSFGGQAHADGWSACHVFTEPGTYRVEVTVDDGSSCAPIGGTTSWWVYVDGPRAEPVAAAETRTGCSTGGVAASWWLLVLVLRKRGAP